MRLLHLIQTPRHSGAEMLVYQLCRLHGNWGHDCAVASFAPPQPEFLETARAMERDGAILFFPKRAKRKLGRTIHFHDAMRRFRPDVVFGQGSLASFYGRFATGWSRRRIRFVSVMHSATNDDYAAFSFQLAERLTRFRVDHVTAVSVEGAENYTRRFGSAVPVGVIKNGVDMSRFAGIDRAAVRERLGLASGKRLALQVGRICEDKGQLASLAALRPALAAGDAELWFAGLTDDRMYEERLRRRVAEWGVEGAVRFLGSRADIPDLLAAADLFLMPSQREAHSVALLEALASGIPIIASDIPVFAFASGLGSVRLCGDGDDSAWATAAGQMLTAPRAARDASGFSMEHTAQAYLDLAERVAK